MKKFSTYYREGLSEAASGGIRDSLNKLQIWWEEYAGPYGFLDPKDPKNVSLFPIMQPPFDMIRKGGVVVLGYNPGASGGLDKAFRDAVDEVRSKDEAGRLPLVYNKEKGGWYYIGRIDPESSKTEIGVRRKRYDKLGDDFKNSAFNNKLWLQDTNNGKKFHKKGAFGFHRAFNKMLDDLGMQGERKKLMGVNWVPFPSKHDSFPRKKEVEKESTQWIKAFLRTAKPKLVMTTTSVFDLAMREMGGKQFTNKVKRPLSKAGNVDNRRFYSSGILSDGTPIIAFAHWSNAQHGGPSNPAWNEENIELMKADIKALMKRRK